MATGELLSIEPLELQFPFELKKQIPCTMQLTNKTDNYVAFKVNCKHLDAPPWEIDMIIADIWMLLRHFSMVKTTNPKKYCVRPNTGIVLPRSTCSVIVTMQSQKEAPSDMQCKDKFLLQGVVASFGASAKDITPEMFSRESGNVVEECKLKVVYVSPPRPPSPVPEGSDEGSSPRLSVSDNGSLSGSEYTHASRSRDNQDNSTEAREIIATLREEKNSAIQKNKRLQQELNLLRHEANGKRGGISFIYVVIVGMIGLLIGYLLNKTKVPQ